MTQTELRRNAATRHFRLVEDLVSQVAGYAPIDLAAADAFAKDESAHAHADLAHATTMEPSDYRRVLAGLLRRCLTKLEA